MKFDIKSVLERLKKDGSYVSIVFNFPKCPITPNRLGRPKVFQAQSQGIVGEKVDSQSRYLWKDMNEVENLETLNFPDTYLLKEITAFLSTNNPITNCIFGDCCTILQKCVDSVKPIIITLCCLLTSSSQSELFLSAAGHLTMSRVIFGFQNWGDGCYWHLMSKSQLCF